MPIHRACDYIHAHFAEKLTLTQVARHVFLNPAYLSRLFRHKTGSTFQHYVTKTRIQAAARLLTQTPRPVQDICRAVGYTNLKHFYQTFHALMGMPPGEYRAARPPAL